MSQRKGNLNIQKLSASLAENLCKGLSYRYYFTPFVRSMRCQMCNEERREVCVFYKEVTKPNVAQPNLT